MREASVRRTLAERSLRMHSSGSPGHCHDYSADKYGNLWQGSGNGGMVGPHPELGQQVDVELRLGDVLPNRLGVHYVLKM